MASYRAAKCEGGPRNGLRLRAYPADDPFERVTFPAANGVPASTYRMTERTRKNRKGDLVRDLIYVYEGDPDE